MMKASAYIWVASATLLMAAAGAVLWWWFAAPLVVGVRPTRGPAVQAVYATGTVEPTVMTAIAPRIGARLVELRTDEGAEVKRGQPLARLENQDVSGALRQLQAQAEFARRDYQRDAAMVKGGIIARAVYDKAKADFEAASAAVSAARAQMDYMMLSAPGDCRVIRRDGEVGEFIAVNQPVFWLSCHSLLRVSADVDEEDVSLVVPGQRVVLRADAFPGRVFEGKVTSITPKGDPVARSYRVRIALPGGSPFQIGMTAEANIVVRQDPYALLIPTSALEGSAVWLVKDGALRHRTVGVGAKGADRTEILSGLHDGDILVQSPDPSYRDGKHVRVAMGDRG